MTKTNLPLPVPRTIDAIDWDRWQPVDPATLVFVRRPDDHVLLIRKQRGLGAGKINAPGGRIEPGETALAGAIREVEEEVCVTPHDLERFGEVRFQFLDGYAIHVHVFLARGHTGTPTETPEAIPMWVPVDAIPYEEMWSDDRLWLPHLLAERRFDGRFIFDGETMLDARVDVGATADRSAPP